jgi:hypothetical protein
MRTNTTLQTSSAVLPDGTYDTALGGDVGLPINDLRGHRLVILAPAGQTLTGVGNMRCYLWHGGLGVWLRNPDLDFEVTVDGERGQAFPDNMQAVRQGDRVWYLRDGVVLAGTATGDDEDELLVRIDGEAVNP